MKVYKAYFRYGRKVWKYLRRYKGKMSLVHGCKDNNKTESLMQAAQSIASVQTCVQF
jgi:hypothetical protein